MIRLFRLIFERNFWGKFLVGDLLGIKFHLLGFFYHASFANAFTILLYLFMMLMLKQVIILNIKKEKVCLIYKIWKIYK